MALLVTSDRGVCSCIYISSATAALQSCSKSHTEMGLYDEVEIEDMDWDQELQGYTYSCPCGDLFQITVVCFACLICFSRLSLLRAVLGEKYFCLVNI